MTTKENEMTTTTTDHIEAAADALRQHLHDRPWDDDPSRTYGALADMQDIARRLSTMACYGGQAAHRATSSDDGRDPTSVAADVDAALGQAAVLLDEVGRLLGQAQNAASHLIWPAP